MSKIFDDAFANFGTNSGASSLGYSPRDFMFEQGPIDTGPVDIQIPEIKLPNEVNSGFGNIFDKSRLALAGLNTIGNLWAAFQSQKLAKRQFNFTKRATEANMANQIQSYNTTLEDRSRSRAAAEGQTSEQSQKYIDKNRLNSFGG